MSKFMKSVLYTNPFIKKRVLNPHNETFDKPAVIIANHTSFLDILAVGMLSPKIIYLVSDWVYNSPVFGIGVKLAGFYPVSQGLEGGVEHLRAKVEEGYSLVVFPEGTRSKDNHIQRFHKGAFYLAEEFNLDIVPILIHGNSELLPKGDFIINNGNLTLKILPRIKAEDRSFGDNYAERTKKIGTFYKEQFAQMRAEEEAPDYFKEMLLNSFVYKEPEIVQSVKDNLKNVLPLYYKMDKHIGAKAKILLLADDHGETAALLTLQQPQRKVYTYVDNKEKRDVAQTNYINRKRSISYLLDVEEAKDMAFDVIIAQSPVTHLPAQKAKYIIFTNRFDITDYPEFVEEVKEDGFTILRKI